MRKKKFYFILTILTIISLFSFAAICTQCGADTEDKVDTEDEEASEDAISQDKEEAGDEDNTESEDGADETENEDEATSEEDTDSDADTDSEEDEDSDAEAPTISLEVYEGPFPTGSLCVYRVKANVTGSPSPSITWSKDDSGGSWGIKKAQVNLNNPADTYTLTATATNSEGSATDSITLSWGCEEPEPEPELEPEVHEIPIAATPEISGEIRSNRLIGHPLVLYIGDTDLNEYSKGYLSFDISGLHGKTIQNAEIIFTGSSSYGNPSSFASEIVIKVFNYVRLDFSDFAVGGVQIPSIPISEIPSTPFPATSYTISGNTLKSELQEVLDNEVRDYFQLKLGLNIATNNDGEFDGVWIDCVQSVLSISYTD